MSAVDGSEADKSSNEERKVLSAHGPEGLKNEFYSELGGNRIEDYSIEDFSVEGKSPLPYFLVDRLPFHDPDVELSLTLEYNVLDGSDAPSGTVQNGWGEDVVLAVLEDDSRDEVKDQLDDTVSSIEEFSTDYDEAYGGSYFGVVGPENGFE